MSTSHVEMRAAGRQPRAGQAPGSLPGAQRFARSRRAGGKPPFGNDFSVFVLAMPELEGHLGMGQN